MRVPRVRFTVLRLMAAGAFAAFIHVGGPVTPGQPPPTPRKLLPNGYLPSRFRLHIGGFFPPSYSVELRGESLLYRARERVPGTEDLRESTKVITPTAAQWRQFWAATEAADLWGWRPRYTDPSVYDGVQWGLEITLEGRRAASSGSNAFPGVPIRPTGPTAPDPHSSGTSPSFERYLRAVEALLGGQSFR